MTAIACDTVHRAERNIAGYASLVSLITAAATGFALILGTNWVVASAVGGFVTMLSGA